MEQILLLIFTILCLVSGTIGRKGFGPGEQEWDFVQVRPGANMFWWLYYTTANAESYYDKPLIIWLEGGPGGSSTAVGNFLKLGPLDMNEKPRDYTWVKDYNVLFIDNPVGTGFSYVENDSGYATTNAQIANDLLECVRGFYAKLPKFKPVPAYITTQSYGGKMGAEFALVWNRAQKAGTIESNLKGVALGSPWISPIDTVLTWGPYLLNTGIVDTEGLGQINAAAKRTKYYVDTGKWQDATTYYFKTIETIDQNSYFVDFDNILIKVFIPNHPLSQNVSSLDSETIYRHFIQRETQSLDDFMNNRVKEELDLNVTHHGAFNQTVFNYLRNDFMKPVTNIVGQLLDTTDLHVFVYNGQLDLIVDTPGTLLWVEKLKWKGARDWRASFRKALISEDVVEGYFKSHNNFGMYWVNRAGHDVPVDNPEAMEIILQDLVSNANRKQKKPIIFNKHKYIKTNNK